ncbi:CHAT domain protein [Stieleria maiorica]|uniref:CHAT domain protein n=1 Tax=Stieleria maiorica TaxID=2795974 RepID=A0A5B9ME46_9BACT|nr:CHAT domain-containing protein [Stieleria maiorica]QEF99542.1 CHAT domain protein [Stieleria maiorica]
MAIRLVASIFSVVCITGLSFAADGGDRFGLTPDRPTLAMTIQDGPVGIHVARGDRMVACEFDPNSPPNRLPSNTKAIVLIDLKTGQEISRMPFREPLVVRTTACSSDGRYLVVCDQRSARQFDLENGVLIRSLPVNSTRSFPVISPTEPVLALCDDRDISLWDLTDGSRIADLPAHPTSIASCDFDDRGTSILSSCQKLTRRWDLATKSSKAIPLDHSLQHMSIAPDGTQIIGQFQKTVMERGVASFDARSGRRLLHLPYHSWPVFDSKADRLFSCDGSSDEGTAIDAVQIRSLASPDRIRYLPFAPEVNAIISRNPYFFTDGLALSPDGKYLIIRLEYGRLSQVWKLDPSMDSLATEFDPALKHLHNPLTPKVASKPKTREELFLEEIRGIESKVRELKDQGKVAEAEQAIQDLLAAGDRRLQRAPIRHQNLIRNCGQAYRHGLGNNQQGLELLQRAIQMAESDGRFGDGWTYLLRQIADTQHALGQHDDAVATYQRYLDHQRSQGNAIDSYEYRQMAEFIADARDAQAALTWRVQAWERSDEQHGALSRHTRDLLDELLADVRETDQWELLQPALVEHYKQSKRLLGPHHPDTAHAAAQLALLFERLGEFELALSGMDESQRAFRDHVARTLPLLSETEQAEFLRQRFQPAFHDALEMAARLKSVPRAAELSAGWVLNAKGASTRALAERHRMTASTRDPEVRKTAEQIAEVREQISSLTLSALQNPTNGLKPTGAVAELNNQLETLRNRESELSWQLGSTGWTELRHSPWSDLSSVRERIPDDAVLLECAVAGVRTKLDSSITRELISIAPTHRGMQAMVWVIPPVGRGEIRLEVVCDDWDKLSRPLIQLHACLGGQMIPNDLIAAINQHLDVISTQVLYSLPDQVMTTPKWLVSPDHQLWRIPFAALTKADGKRVIEDHEVQYLLSGRDLLATESVDPVSAPMMVANPDYGNEANGQSDAVPFSPLPGTAKEAEAVSPYLRTLTGSVPQVFLGAGAAEDVVKTANRPQIAVFSTHGFSEYRHEQHPMATCGLAFANANSAFGGQGDGILTGLEILDCDFRGTELVVLSACQTAVGSASSGEGVAGLSHAFRLAGAKTVVGTLWSIPDQITADLMKDFFDQLSEGKPPAASLRSAQLATIRRLDQQGLPPMPHLWAAFTATGISQPIGARASAEEAPEFRTWRSTDGKHTTVAKWIATKQDRVVLQKKDGDQIEVNLNHLHADDRQWLRERKGDGG